MDILEELHLEEEQRRVIEAVDHFEDLWNRGAGELNNYLHSLPDDLRRLALNELVRVDFERRHGTDEPKSVLEYIHEHPTLLDCEESRSALENLELKYKQLVEGGPSNQSGFESRDLSERGSHLSELKDRHGFEIIDELGKGSFGVVYRARELELDRLVALKVFQKPIADFLHEARVIAKIQHPNIVKVFRSGELSGGVKYIVYELVSGTTLSKRIKSNDCTFNELKKWFSQIANALHVVHASKIYHRDISPGNILIDEDSNARLIDFGLASNDGRFFQPDRGIVLGTPAYMSPEQAQGKAHWATAQSDVFALGATLYHALTGRPPFTGETPIDVLEQVIDYTPTPPRSLCDEIPVALESVCLKAMQKEPSNRFRTAKEFANEIQREG